MAHLTKILLLCVDAADADLIETWSEAGYLPTWQSLRHQGFVATLENAPGLYSGAVWPSFYTSLWPGRHGRYFFRQIVTGSYKIAPFTANDVKREPFWNAVSRAGRRIAVIDVPKSPLTTSPNVLQIADWGTHDRDYDDTHCSPDVLLSELTARFGTDPVGTCDFYDHDLEGMRRLRDRLIERIQKKEAMLADFLRQSGWDLFIGAFSESHCAGHQFWHIHDATHPKHDPDQLAALGDPLLDVYRAIDGALGRLIRIVGDDVHVLVYASHGMAAHYDGTFLLDEVLRRLDGMAPAFEHRAVQALVPLWRMLPQRWRTAVRGLVTVVDESTRLSDRRRRTCFVVPTNDNCAGIRVNLRGREPQGRVSAGDDYDAFCRGLVAELKELVNVQTGRSAVRAVHRTDRIFPGEYCDDLPDILVQWHRDTPFSGLSSPKVGKVLGTYSGCRTGDHRPGGLLVACGPGLQASKSAVRASVVDIAPTISSALGVALEDVDGRPIQAITDALVHCHERI